VGKYKRFDIIEKMDNGDLSVWTVELPVTFFNSQLSEGCLTCGTPEEVMNELKHSQYLMNTEMPITGHGDYLVDMCCAVGLSCGIGPMQRCNPCPLSSAQLPDRDTRVTSKQGCLEYVRRHPEIISTLKAYVKDEEAACE